MQRHSPPPECPSRKSNESLARVNKNRLNICHLALLGLALLFSGCASRQSQLGVKNLWRNNDSAQFEKGTTTQSDVMQVLGPPSQVIGLQDQTIFYYLREQLKSKSLVLVIYNDTREQITYDRAIFFFDTKGILKDYAFSDEQLPTK